METTRSAAIKKLMDQERGATLSARVRISSSLEGPPPLFKLKRRPFTPISSISLSSSSVTLLSMTTTALVFSFPIVFKASRVQALSRA